MQALARHRHHGFKSRYHAASLEGIPTKLANPPLEVPAQYDKVRDTLLRALDARNAQFAKQS